MSTGVINITLADGSAPPAFLEYGISTVAEQLPTESQTEPEFVGLENGVYYVFFRKIGSNWNHNHVIVKEVNCNDGSVDTSAVISRRAVALTNVSNGHTLTFIDNILASTVDKEYFFICDFFAEDTATDNSYGSKIPYVDYKKIDRNTIELMMDEDVTFTGTIIIQRL